MTERRSLEEISGLAGLLGLDDNLLEQVRDFQEHISPFRRVGTTVEEYRVILKERLERQEPYRLLFPDSLVSILDLSVSYPTGNLSKTMLIGMISVTVSVGQSFSEATIFDLYVRKEYRDDAHSVARRLVQHCHQFLRRISVSRAVVRLPIKRKAVYRKVYEAIGFSHDPQLGQLAVRFKPEG